MGETKRVLVTVMTYPQPSLRYDEIVCTAGVLEDGSLVRLYPIDYRYRPYGSWYSKYQWIEVKLRRRHKDPRPESYRPVGDIVLGEKIETEDNWFERKRWVLRKGTSSMCDLMRRQQSELSLGTVKPRKIRDIKVEETSREWSPKHLQHMNQINLFGETKKPLEKIPYSFKYRFLCEEDECKGHTMTIIDWEVGVLYRRMRDKHEDEEVAREKVREAFLERRCGPDMDVHFFVGTVLRHNTWMVLGTFCPKKEHPRLPLWS